MRTTFPTTRKITNDDILDLRFFQLDVLSDPLDQSLRNTMLEVAIKQSHESSTEASILFESICGLKELEAKVWGLTEKEVILSGGTYLPLKSIVSIAL